MISKQYNRGYSKYPPKVHLVEVQVAEEEIDDTGGNHYTEERVEVMEGRVIHPWANMNIDWYPGEVNVYLNTEEEKQDNFGDNRRNAVRTFRNQQGCEPAVWDRFLARWPEHAEARKRPYFGIPGVCWECGGAHNRNQQHSREGTEDSPEVMRKAMGLKDNK